MFRSFISSMLVVISLSSSAQKRDNEVDVALVRLYEKYFENKYDYKGGDSILSRFKVNLKNALRGEDLNHFLFPEWDQKYPFVISENKKLAIFSWDWQNNGSQEIVKIALKERTFIL